VRRVLSAAVLIALLIVSIWVLPAMAAVALAAIIATLAGIELASLSTRAGAWAPGGFVGPAAAVLSVAFALGATASGLGDGTATLATLALIIGAGAVTLAAGSPAPVTVSTAAVCVMAPIYIGLPLGTIAWLQIVRGPYVVSLLAVLVIASDSAQYFAGRLLGRHKLAPSVSPAKTIEGALGGLVGAGLVGGLLGARWIAGLSPAGGTVVGVLVAIVGMLGDLFESLLKRSAGVKDSSTLIPGHGGVLDRIDSWLFAAPAYYAFLRYFA
jgi:phosphatidate cytidylyltransferase